METPIFHALRALSIKKRSPLALYGAMMLLSLHWFIVLYINSSFLEQFIGKTAVGTLYTLSAAFTILGLLFITPILKRTGNYALMLALISLEFIVVTLMAFANSLQTAIPLFMIHQTIVPLILFNLDVLMEKISDERIEETGRMRGLSLGIMSLGGGVAPLIAGQLIGFYEGSFRPVYLLAAAILLPLFYIVTNYLRTFKAGETASSGALSAPDSFWSNRNIRNVFFAHLLMHIFFCFMVIYTPLYLAHEAGFSWSEIGLILFVAMMAYVIFEYPIGIIADRYIGEKEMMAVGFFVLATSTIALAYIPYGNISAWMAVMFVTRIGASLVEVTTEGYFFKRTRGDNTRTISFFRISRPLSYVLGALLGSFVLLYASFSTLFVVLGILMFFGIYFTLRIEDTK